ncbi:hypothetical protein PR048_032103 [Dryococelus australis]|uniref:Uncharacterized protein n=1 Tax=Dryococelus australis TaxID=614101 RepID=A0ABQ9G196_9NEOP|nr:hypothetical protein PR048_032103 [Dryococelus australis]
MLLGKQSNGTRTSLRTVHVLMDMHSAEFDDAVQQASVHNGYVKVEGTLGLRDKGYHAYQYAATHHLQPADFICRWLLLHDVAE